MPKSTGITFLSSFAHRVAVAYRGGGRSIRPVVRDSESRRKAVVALADPADFASAVQLQQTRPDQRLGTTRLTGQSRGESVISPPLSRFRI